MKREHICQRASSRLGPLLRGGVYKERGNENHQRLADQRLCDPARFVVRRTLTDADGAGRSTSTWVVTSGTTGFIALVADSCCKTARCRVEADDAVARHERV